MSAKRNSPAKNGASLAKSNIRATQVRRVKSVNLEELFLKFDIIIVGKHPRLICENCRQEMHGAFKELKDHYAACVGNE